MDYHSIILQSLLVLILLKSAYSHSLTKDALNDIANRTQCVALCSDCGCLGYFCGEECICECLSDSDKDINCLSKLKTHCDNLNLPYEVLIQGSAGRRFVREIRDLTPKQEQFYHTNERRGRSVYNIHSPNPWRSGKEEPVAFEDTIVGAPGLAGDLGAIVNRIKTDAALLNIKQRLLSPLPGLPGHRRDLLNDVRSDLRDGYERLRDGVRAIPHRIDDVTTLKLKPLVPRRENILKEKIDKIAAVVDTSREADTVVETLAKIKDYKLRELVRDISPNRLTSFLRSL